METPTRCGRCGTRLNRYNRGVLCWPCMERVRVSAVLGGMGQEDVVRWAVGKRVVTRGFAAVARRLRGTDELRALLGRPQKSGRGSAPTAPPPDMPVPNRR